MFPLHRVTYCSSYANDMLISHLFYIMSNKRCRFIEVLCMIVCFRVSYLLWNSRPSTWMVAPWWFWHDIFCLFTDSLGCHKHRKNMKSVGLKGQTWTLVFWESTRQMLLKKRVNLERPLVAHLIPSPCWTRIVTFI